MRRYILVDCGYHKGESIERFRQTDSFSRHDWEIYAFEPNAFLCSQATDKSVNLINAAIWTEDGKIDFYLAEDSSSSSILKHKTTGNLSQTPVKVSSIDFSRWLKENCTYHDYVIVNMNIEGAEYSVLPYLISSNSMILISKLYIEFHNEKVGVPRSKDSDILYLIDDYSTEVVTKAL